MQFFRRLFLTNNAKLWTNIIFFVATWKVWHTDLDKISETVFLGWMAIAGGTELLKRIITGKFGITTEEPTHEQDKKENACALPNHLQKCPNRTVREGLIGPPSPG